MIGLIVAMLFSLGLTYFSLQNAHLVTLYFGNYIITNVPLYLIVIAAILAGILIAWIINTINILSKRTLTQLKQELYELERENEQLRNINNEESPREEKQNQRYATPLVAA